MASHTSTRRGILGAIAIAPVVIAAPALATPHTNSNIHALIAKCYEAERVVDAHSINVLDRSTGEAFKRELERNNDLNDLWADAMDDVAACPVRTIADFRTKLAFMNKHHMGEGRNWLEQFQADAARLA